MITLPFASCKCYGRWFWGQMPNLNPVQWSETFVGRFERFVRPARYLYLWVFWRLKKKQYGRVVIFQHNEKSPEIDSKTHFRILSLVWFSLGTTHIFKFKLTVKNTCMFVPSMTQLFNHTFWVAIATPTDRPKSVRHRCVIEGFGGVFGVFTLLLFFFLWV